MRVLDCKVPSCREAMSDAPSLSDYLCSDCKTHFDMVKKSLDKLKISFEIDKQLVRGLDYYTRTTFELQTGSLGAQSAVAGGGRYDGLIKALGGSDIPGIGFAIGFDRLAEIVSLNRPDIEKKADIFIAALGEKAQEKAFEWSCTLGISGIQAETDMANGSLKSQMKKADRSGADYVLIIGDKELEQGAAVLRNMTTKEQTEILMENVLESVTATVRR